jgi:hypothetical protein
MIRASISPRRMYSLTVRVLRRDTSAASRNVARSPIGGAVSFLFAIMESHLLLIDRVSTSESGLGFRPLTCSMPLRILNQQGGKLTAWLPWSVICLFALTLSLISCGTQKRNEGLAELQRVQSTVHEMSVVVTVGANQPEFSSALDRRPVEDRRHSTKRATVRAIVCCDDRATHTDAASTVRFCER